MSAYDLVTRAKEKLKVNSDGKIAEILGVSRMHVSNWKLEKNKPDGIAMLKLTELAELSAHDALILVTKSPAKPIAEPNQISDMMYIMLNSILNRIKKVVDLEITKVFALR